MLIFQYCFIGATSHVHVTESRVVQRTQMNVSATSTFPKENYVPPPEVSKICQLTILIFM